jgi:hypothetical protein
MTHQEKNPVVDHVMTLLIEHGPAAMASVSFSAPKPGTRWGVLSERIVLFEPSCQGGISLRGLGRLYQRWLWLVSPADSRSVRWPVLRWAMVRSCDRNLHRAGSAFDSFGL